MSKEGASRAFILIAPEPSCLLSKLAESPRRSRLPGARRDPLFCPCRIPSERRSAPRRDATEHPSDRARRGQAHRLRRRLSPDRTLKTRRANRGKIAYLPPNTCATRAQMSAGGSAGCRLVGAFLARQRLFQRASMPRTVEAVWVGDPIPPPQPVEPFSAGRTRRRRALLLKSSPGAASLAPSTRPSRLEAISAEIDARPGRRTCWRAGSHRFQRTMRQES